jgi:plastocyanin
LAAAGIAVSLAAGAWPAAAQDAPATIALTIKDHRFTPATIEIPANAKVKLVITNADATAEEFDSSALHREKVIPAGGTGSLFIGPLKPGSYAFEGEYHEDTAKGQVVVK